MEKRTRPNQLKIRLSDKELAQVRQKYGQFRELQHLLSKTSTNVNQITKKVNTCIIW